MRRTWVGLSALAVAIACGDGDVTGITANRLVGTWEATNLEFVNRNNPLQVVNFSAHGIGLTAVFRSNGRYTISLHGPGVTDTSGGSWALEVGQLVLRDDGDPDPLRFDASLSGNVLTAVTNDAQYDFNGDATDDPATLRMVLIRQ
jgi:hypothetical protein